MLELFDSEPRIDLRCPNCGAEWSAEVVLFGAWWGTGITPEAIASTCHCPYCHAMPPMEVTPPEPLHWTQLN